MKPHLPILLRRAVLACFTALTTAPFTTMAAKPTIPNGYTSVEIDKAADFEDYYKESEYAFLLTGDTPMTLTPENCSWWSGGTALFTGRNYFFGSENEATRISLIFNGGENGAPSAFHSGGTLDFRGLADISFINLSGSQYSPTHVQGIRGGALSSMDSFSFHSNLDITFLYNHISSTYNARGGAISVNQTSPLQFIGNRDISFSENHVYSTEGYAAAGAIDVTNFGSLEFIRNRNITFGSNSSCSETKEAFSGALNALSLSFEENGEISFIGNSTSSATSSVGGGAIFSLYLAFVGNSMVTFQDNYVRSDGGKTYGGAIRQNMGGTFILRGPALFRRNFELVQGKYQMRSIYQSRGSACYPTMELSAPSGQRIAFFDSVYSDLIATIVLNRDYDIGGVIQEAKGDILISGATMKEDLTAIKGSLPTEEELNNSLSSELHGEVTLYGGRLRIEDGVRLTVLYFCTAEGSNATLLLKNAAMKGRAPLSGLYLSTGSALDLQGINTITAGYLTMAEGTTMAFTLDYRNTSSAVLTMEAGDTVTGTLNTDNLTLKLEGVDLANGIYKLITLQEPNTQYNYNLWTADRVSIEGLNACFNDMIWNNGTLYLLHQSDRNMPENRILIKKGDNFETRRDQDSVTFLIGDDVTVDSTEFKWWGDGEPLLTGKRILFTSSDQDSSYSMNSDGGSYKKRVRFVVSDDLFFNGLNNISLRDYVTADNESPGGAILFSASLRFSENNDISFIQNITSLHGGAISTSYDSANSILTFLNNGNIVFSENRSGGLGGAIMLHAFSSSEAASSVVNFTENKNVLFSNNSASMNRESAEGGYSYAEGGAIYMYADSNTTAPTSILSFHNNGDVVFQGNFAQANDGIANGGAIGGYADCSFADNGDIKFINNYAISTSSLPDSCWGGAISLPGNSITFSACDDIQFCNNYMDLTCTSETAWLPEAPSHQDYH